MATSIQQASQPGEDDEAWLYGGEYEIKQIFAFLW